MPNIKHTSTKHSEYTSWIIQFFENRIAHKKNIQDTSELYLFPNAQSKKYWTTYLSKKFGCIVLDNFLTLPQFQKKLQFKMAAQYEYPIRFLTSQEQEYLLSRLLQQPHIQTLVCSIEQINSIEHIHHYVNRLHLILKEYLIYHNATYLSTHLNNSEPEETYASPYISAVEQILDAYDALLTEYRCMDTIILAHRMGKQSYQNSKTMHCNIFYPELYAVDDMSWITCYGKDVSSPDPIPETVSDSGHASTPLLFSFNRHISTNNATLPQITQAQFWPACLNKEENNVLYIYDTVQKELDTIFAGIAEIISPADDLKKPRILPHEIMLALGEKDELLEVALLFLSKKYQVPIQLHKTKTHLLGQLITFIDDVYRTNFSPATLSALFSEPVLFWKNEDMNNHIIALGKNNACINNNNLDRWFYLLWKNNDETLTKYFSKLSKHIKNIIKAKNFDDMYVHIYNLCDNFLKDTPRKLGADDSDKEEHTCNMLLHTIEQHISFETYLNTVYENAYENVQKNDHQEPPPKQQKNNRENTEKKQRPWDILKSHITADTMGNKKTGVQICSVIQAMGSEYEYCFIANLSQQSFIQSTSHQHIFNDLVSSQYTTSSIEKKYLQYGKDIVSYLNKKSHHIYMSCSEQGTSGVQLLPVYWDVKKLSNNAEYDIWKAEQSFWKHKDMLPNSDNFFITHAQKRGLSHISAIQIAHKTNKHKRKQVNTNIYKHILKESISNISLHPSSVTGLLHTEQFIFENIFDIDLEPYIIEQNYDLQEYILWGGVYHKILEKALIYEIKHSSESGITVLDNTTISAESNKIATVQTSEKTREKASTDINTDTNIDNGTPPPPSDAGENYSNKNINKENIEYLQTVLEQPLMKFIKGRGVPEVLITHFYHYLATMNIKAKTQALIEHLTTLDTQGKIRVEETLKTSLFTVLDGIEDFTQTTTHYKQYLSEMTLNGRVDLLYQMRDESQYIIDYKRKSSPDYDNAHLLQVWLYYLAWNYPHIKTSVKERPLSSSLYDEKKAYMGNLFFLFSDEAFKLNINNKTFEDEKIYCDMMPHIFNEALLRLFTYPHHDKNALSDENHDIYETMISYYDALKKAPPIALKCILREGGYIYAL